LNNKNCIFTPKANGYLSALAFSTELGFDHITIGGIRYSGSQGPSSVQIFKGEEVWESDEAATFSGFAMCLQSESNGAGLLLKNDATLHVPNSSFRQNNATKVHND
jgi:hypothetical protein